MPSRHLSYGFTKFPCRSHPEGSILRPMLSVTLSYKGQDPIDMSMLVDSGADFSVIPVGIARSLGIDMSTLRKDRTNGIGGSTEVAWALIDLAFGQRGNDFDIRMPFQILLNEDYDNLPLLGREPFFLWFDVNFRMAYAYPKGKFVLSEVTKTRDPDKYNFID